MSEVIGIHHDNVTAWMVENLTFKVTDASGRLFALRRPPTSHVLPTAHDMVREHTVISGLAPLGIPVAQPLGLCVDESVNERPFYVMDFVDGAILRDRRGAEAAFDVATRRQIGANLASTLAESVRADARRRCRRRWQRGCGR